MFPARRFFKLYSNKNQTGQGIIEIVVVLGLAAILILSLVALSVRSNRSANFSRAEDQSARLAQEGMEILRNIRESKPDNIRDGGTPQDWNWLYTQVFSTPDQASFENCSGEICLNLQGSGEIITIDSRDFTRSVFIHDTHSANSNECNALAGGDQGSIKLFRVDVTWNDTSGAHTSTTSSCFRKGS